MIANCNLYMIAPSGLRDDMVVITDADANNTTIVDQQHRVAFVYPEGGGNSSIQVEERDVRHLNPNQSSPKDKYLTDTAIDFIAKHLVDTTPNQSKGCLPFVSSVLFHTHLRSLLDICNKDSTQQFSTTWYESFIHGHHMILAANHGQDHFSCTSLWNPWTEPIIFHYDPIFGYHAKNMIFEPFRAYLSSAKHKEFLSNNKIPEPKFVQLRGPQQINSFDCGLYALKFIQYSLSMEVTLDSQDPYVTFSEAAWSAEDILQMRTFYYRFMVDLRERYTADHQHNGDGGPTVEVSNDGGDSSTADVSQSKDESSDYKPDILFDSFIIKKFGSWDSYFSKIPADKDQNWLRKVFDGKLDLLTFWKSKKSGINCGYIGCNKEDMRIYKKFIFEPSIGWAPPNFHSYDECPFDINRYFSLYGYQSFAVTEVASKLLICGYALYNNDVGHRYLLWVNNLTLCWNPRREYIIYDTEKCSFTFVQGKQYLRYL